jgi:hypothetical protein
MSGLGPMSKSELKKHITQYEITEVVDHSQCKTPEDAPTQAFMIWDRINRRPIHRTKQAVRDEKLENLCKRMNEKGRAKGVY